MNSPQTVEERRQKIMTYLAQNPGASELDMWDTLNVSDWDVDADLAYFRTNGWVRKVGNSRWSLTEEGMAEAKAQHWID